ncbi:MAG: hypothetical protein E6J90_34555 [Deltaproteobacteria bacterium]|nr:MAG: hypothetical protein E6J90_34555 [Deltaproteobacteria bacterium]TMQ21134.1 MAG: hypothetical protein E6J91_03050 [Deltaproteobacteria bacterium]
MTTPRAFSLTEAEHRRIERIDQLVLLGAAGVGELMADLNDASWTVRRAAVAGLAALGDDAVDPLCRWLSRDRSSERAISAVVDALSASVGASATPVVLGLFDDPRPAVVSDAAPGVFDAILCRNVLIYFQDERILRVIDRLVEHLAPDGLIAVGASESLLRFGTRLMCEERGSSFFYRCVR